MVYRIDVSTASATPPVPGTPGTEGFPTAGSPGTVPATIIDPYFIYALGEELRNIALGGGQTPTKSLVNQALTAIQIIAGLGAAGQNVVTGSYQMVESDLGKIILVDSTSAATITLLPLPASNGVTTMPNYTGAVVIRNIGSAPVTIAPATGGILDMTVKTLRTAQSCGLLPASDINSWRQLWNDAPSFQTITDQTANRALGTIYTNTNSSPMAVGVTAQSTSTGNNLQILVNGITVTVVGVPASGVEGSVFAIVPPGATYEVSAEVGSFTLQHWSETV
jgi:hypothetical protein